MTKNISKHLITKKEPTEESGEVRLEIGQKIIVPCTDSTRKTVFKECVVMSVSKPIDGGLREVKLSRTDNGDVIIMTEVAACFFLGNPHKNTR